MASPHVAGAAAILAAQDKPKSKADVEAIRDTILEAGNFDWEDTSGDEIQEPLLDVGDEDLFENEPKPPVVATQAASEVVSEGARLNGSVNPKGSATSYQFEYGTTSSYGSKAPASPQDIGSGKEPVAVDVQVEGLEPQTTHHFRVRATNAVGTTFGQDQTFTTPLGPVASLKSPDQVGRQTAKLRGSVTPERRRNQL